MHHKFLAPARIIAVLALFILGVYLTHSYSSRLQASLEGVFWTPTTGLRAIALVVLPTYSWPLVVMGELLAKAGQYAKEAHQWGSLWRDLILEVIPILMSCLAIGYLRFRRFDFDQTKPRTLVIIFASALFSSLALMLTYALVLLANNPSSWMTLLTVSWSLMLDDLVSIALTLPPIFIGHAVWQRQLHREHLWLVVWLSVALIAFLIMIAQLESLPNTLRLILYIGTLLVSMRLGWIASSFACLWANALTVFSHLKWSGPEDLATAQIYILTLTVSCLLLGAYASDGRRQNRNLRDYAARLTSAEDHERQRISSELHDDIGQNLTAMRLQLSLLKKQSSNTEAVANVAEMLGRLISSSHESVYRLIHELNPVELEVMGFEHSIKEGRLAQLLAASNIDYEVIVKGDSGHLSDDVAAVAFRVVQECVSNCVKYAGATKFTVMLDFQRQGLRLVVEDNGKGFDVNAPRTNIGLKNIASRCESVGGYSDIASSPAGTRITANLPCVNI
ncbi:MAG: hypothetical protein RLZZ602_1864 [Pseudomonadota bacterium]